MERRKQEAPETLSKERFREADPGGSLGLVCINDICGSSFILKSHLEAPDSHLSPQPQPNPNPNLKLQRRKLCPNAEWIQLN